MAELIECAGAPRDLGWDQGRACRSALRAALPTGRLQRLFARPDAETARVLRDLRRHYPHQAEMLEGLARGAGVALVPLGRAMLQSLHPAAEAVLAARLADGRCAVAVEVPSAARLRRSRPEGRFSSVELTLPVLTTALLGVNEAGLVVAASPGAGEPSPCRAPAPLLVRDCLERFAAVEAALEWCLERPAAGRGSLLLADASGAVAVELRDGQRAAVRPADGLLLVPDPGGRGMELAKALEPDLPGAAALAAALERAVPGCAAACADPQGRRLRPPRGGWVTV